MNLISRQVCHRKKNWGRGADVKLVALKRASLFVAPPDESPVEYRALEKLKVVVADDECLETV